MATQKPGEWANTLITRFEEQVSNSLNSCNYGKYYYKTAHLLINIYMIANQLL